MNIQFSSAESTVLLPAVKRRALSYRNDVGWDRKFRIRMNNRMENIEMVVAGAINDISRRNRAMLTGIVRELITEYQPRITHYQDMPDADLVLAWAGDLSKIRQVNNVLSLFNKVNKEGYPAPLIGACVGQLRFLISQSKDRLFYVASDTNIYKFGVPAGANKYIEIPMTCDFNLITLEKSSLKNGLPQTSCNVVSDVQGLLAFLDEHEFKWGLSGRQKMLKNILLQVSPQN